MVIGGDGGPGESVASRVEKVFIRGCESVTTQHPKMVENNVKGKVMKRKIVWKCNVEQVSEKHV